MVNKVAEGCFSIEKTNKTARNPLDGIEYDRNSKDRTKCSVKYKRKFVSKVRPSTNNATTGDINTKNKIKYIKRGYKKY